jgi:2-polyprenyl-6-methoxyphenol hydroxylase-like FAD-dependent oxidoreductase
LLTLESIMSESPAAEHFDTDVLVVGAGPCGLTLATALAAQHTRVTVIDRQAEGANTSRAAVVHARTLEVLESVDVATRLVARGLKAHQFTLRDRDRVLMNIGFEDLPTRYPYTLMVSQAVTEQVLLKRFTELGGRVLRPRCLVDLHQDGTGATAKLDDGRQVRARYVVGTDGMHSTVRERAGIAFTGAAYGESFVLADVRLTGGVPRDEVILFFSTAGMVVVAPLPDGVHRIVATVDEAPERPDIAYVQALLDGRGPKADPAVVHDVTWSSRFRVHHRIADVYRSGRVLLAGDAAHVHSPAGGQGMNAGILDAVALAAALKGAMAGDALALNAYGATRRPIAEQIVTLADRLTRMATLPSRWRPLRNLLLSTLSRIPALRRQLAWRLSGLVYRAA